MNSITRVQLHDVESLQIAAIGYDPGTQTLAVRFKNWKGEATSLYHYDHVTPEDYAALQAAESKGGHFNRFIKPFPEKFPYRKIEDKPQDLAA